MTEDDFYSQAKSFLQHLFAEIRNHKVELQPHWSIDHLCFRVESQESYERHKRTFSQFGAMLIESEVNGRMIATYKIDVVELPAPKAGKVTPEGFEHIEVVVDEPSEKLIAQYPSKELLNLSRLSEEELLLKLKRDTEHQ